MTATTLLLLAGVVLLVLHPGGLAGLLGTSGTPAAATPLTTVGVYDPTGAIPAPIQWAAYPATPPTGFHWQSAGSPGAVLATSPPPQQVLVRDGFTMPMMV